MKFDRDNFYEDSLEFTKDGGEGTHQAATRVPGAGPPRERQTPSWMPGGPPRCPLSPILPPGVKTLEKEQFWSFSAASWRKPTEKKKPSPAGRFRRGDHLPEGEIIAIVVIIVTGII